MSEEKESVSCDGTFVIYKAGEFLCFFLLDDPCLKGLEPGTRIMDETIIRKGREEREKIGI